MTNDGFQNAREVPSRPWGWSGVSETGEPSVGGEASFKSAWTAPACCTGE